MLTVIQQSKDLLRALETIADTPLRANFGKDHQISAQRNGQDTTHSAQYWVTLGNEAIRSLSLLSPTPELDQLIDDIARGVFSLIYRSSDLTKGDALTEHEKNQLETTLLQTISTKPALYPQFTERPLQQNQQRAFSPSEKGQIQELAYDYPLLARLLLDQPNKHPTLIKSFIQFCLRDNQSVAVWAKAPGIAALLKETTLSSRFGTTGISGASFIENRGGVQQVGLLIDGVFRPCLGAEARATKIEMNDRSVNRDNLPKGYLTIQQIFDRFKRANNEYIDLSVVYSWNRDQELGIVLLQTDSLRITRTNQDGTSVTSEINLENPEWLKTLPTQRKVSREELSGICPNQPLPQEGSYGLLLGATRQSRSRSEVLKTHAFLTILLPVEGEDSFYMVCMGYQPVEIPHTLPQLAGSVAGTFPAVIHFPDESFFATHRYLTYRSLPLTTDQFNILKAELKKFILAGRQQEIVFQSQQRNCAFFCQEVFNKVFGAPFYNELGKFCSNIIPNWNEWGPQQLKKIVEGQNKASVHALALKISEQLCSTSDTENSNRLLRLCKDHLKQLFPEQPLEENLETSCSFTGDPIHDEPLKEGLRNLLIFTIESQLFFVTPLDRTSSAMGDPLLKVIRSIPWKSIRSWLYSILLFILGSWRGHTVPKPDGTSETFRVVSGPLGADHLMLPATLFSRVEELPNQAARITALFRPFIPQAA